MLVATVVLVSVTVLQRLALPLGGSPAPLALVTCGAAVAYGLLRGLLRFDPRSTRWFLLAMSATTAVALADLVGRSTVSLPSLLLLVVTWSLFCLRVEPRSRHLFPRVADRFEKFMVVFAALGVLQVLTQFAGVWDYTDLLGAALPRDLLFQGFNTSYPITYGSPVIKANGFVFVEPSVFSQFLAMAVLSNLSRGRDLWRSVLFLTAMVCAVAGTGIMVLVVGLAVLAWRRGGAWAVRVGAGLAVAAVVALLTPIGPILLSRAGEGSNTNSSGSLRFVQPYQFIASTWSTDPWSVLTGLGPGQADRIADATFAATGLPISFASAAKLVLEYGLPASVLVGAFFAVVLLRRSPSPTLAVAGLFLNAVTSSSLLSANIVYLLLPLATMFGGQRFELSARERRAGAQEQDGPPDAGTPTTDPLGATRR